MRSPFLFTRAEQPPDLNTRMSRRFFLTLGLQLGVGTLLAARMYRLQVVESSDLRRIAEENRVNLQSIAPRRGQVVDRNGETLATAVHRHSVLLARSRSRDPEASLMRVDALAPIPDDRLRAIREALRQDGGAALLPLLDDADWSTVARIAANAPALPDIEIERSWTRRYPSGEAFAHIVGYVGIPSEQDIARSPALRPLQSIPDLRIGKRGVERVHDDTLRGRPGTARFEVDSSGNRLRELRRDPPTSGRDLVLTLDGGLQRFAYRLLAEQVGAAVVMDIHSGNLMCMVSTPGFDPNLFVSGISTQDWERLRGHPRKPLVHRALNGEYAPGSTFKLAVALAALEADVRGPGDRTPCIGHTDLGQLRFHCWKRGGHGVVNMHEAIKQSCDVYFYRTASDLGIDRIQAMAQQLGLGERYDELGLANSRIGLIPTRAWKRSVIGAAWTLGDSYNAGIGQGYVLATPLQLAVLAARIANGRWQVRPRLTFDNRQHEPLDIGENSLAVVRNAMDAACNEPGGTAFGSRLSPPVAAIGGKTGTSQVRRITLEKRIQGLPDQEDIPWEERNHAMFVGFAPTLQPRYAVSVLVEHGGSGSRAAAPIARKLLHHALSGRPPLTQGGAEA